VTQWPVSLSCDNPRSETELLKVLRTAYVDYHIALGILVD
jgi:hypothetical protein